MKLALLGDIAFIGNFSAMSDFDLERKLGSIKDYLLQFDYVVGNLETPFSFYKKRHGAKSAFLCADKEAVKNLKYLKIDAVNLANNHIYDYGMEGLEFTRRLLEANGIDYFGVAGKSLRKTIGNSKLAFEGFCCYSTNAQQLCDYGQYGVNKYERGGIELRLNVNDEQGWLNILSVHAGKEHVNFPSIDHIRAARQLTNVCRYVYYGHHPHVIQGIEEFNGSLIAHSLGNFCFDDIYTKSSGKEPLITLTENNRTGMILELIIEQNKVTSWNQQAIYIGKDGTLSLVDRRDEMTQYNSVLLHALENEDEYSAMRQKILDDWIKERKSKRDIKWIVKRLHPEYIRLMIDMRRNKRLYDLNVTRLLKDVPSR